MIRLKSKWEKRNKEKGINSSVVACWMSMSLHRVESGDESCIGIRAQSNIQRKRKRTNEELQRKLNVNSTLAFFMLKLANLSVFFVPSEMTGAIIYCTLYCIKYVTDVTVHLYINIFIQYVVYVYTTNTNCIV